MNALDAARDHYLARFDAFAGALGAEPEWLAALRRDARDRFAESGLPHNRLEEWRYTNVAPIAKVPLELPRDEGPAAISRQALERVSFPVFACSIYVFVNGRFAPELSAPRALSGEVRIESLAALRAGDPARLEPWLGRGVDTKQHPFAALNTAFLDDGAAVLLPEGTALEQPLHVVFLTTGGEPCVRHPRLLVVAGAGSRATIVQDHVSLDGAAGFTNAVSEVFVGRNAGLDLVLLQRERADELHVSNLAVRQERDSHFSAHTVTLAGRLVRNDAQVLLADEGAECALRGLFLGEGEQVIDNHSLIDHAMPHGTSRELYKGVLGGRARGVFRGRVIVRPDAQKTVAEQSNPNLLLTDGAEIDTKPQLEIYADDVRCNHGSAIGQLDADALFYLRARGLDETRARSLLTGAFAAEILEGIPLPPLAQALREDLLARLDTGGEEGA